MSIYFKQIWFGSAKKKILFLFCLNTASLSMHKAFILEKWTFSFNSMIEIKIQN